MKICFVTPVTPRPGGNGLAIRAGLFLDGLARAGDVRLAVVPTPGETVTASRFTAERAASITAVDRAGSSNGREVVTRLLSTPEGRRRAGQIHPLPVTCRLPSERGTVMLREAVRGVELVHVMRGYLAPCLDFLLDAPRRPAITLDLDELDSELFRQLGMPDEADRFVRLEREYLPRFDHIYVASEREAELVERKHGLDRVTVIPNTVWPPDDKLVAERDYDLLFVGNLSYGPNVDAVSWLCEEIRPLLGEVTIAIVGSGPTPRVRALAGPCVTVAADVPDVSAWYARSRVAVVPLRIGGGSPTKTVEALAHGRPVVATNLGATGAGAGVMIADGPRSFAQACQRLLGDHQLAARLAEAGRAALISTEGVAERIAHLARAHLSAGARAPL